MAKEKNKGLENLIGTKAYRAGTLRELHETVEELTYRLDGVRAILRAQAEIAHGDYHGEIVSGNILEGIGDLLAFEVRKLRTYVTRSINELADIPAATVPPAKAAFPQAGPRGRRK